MVVRSVRRRIGDTVLFMVAEVGELEPEQSDEEPSR
jgi:hypothetical protein